MRGKNKGPTTDVSKVAVIYYRVSGEGQRDKHTIASQRRLVPPFVTKDLGCTVLEVIEDDGLSGETIAKRPGFQRVLELAEKRAFGTLAVIDIDRITRATKDMEGAFIFDTLQENGVAVAVPGQGIIDLDNEDQALFVRMKRAMSGWELLKIRKRTINGRVTRALEHRRHNMRDPYGYRWVPDEKLASGGTYQLVPEEADVLRRIIAMRLEGVGVPTIVQRLREEGVVWRKSKRNKTGFVCHSTIHKILKSRHLKGELVRKVHQDAPEVCSTVPAVVDATTWLRLQQVGQEYRPDPARKLPEALLRRMARCECGYSSHPLLIDGHIYYRCLTRTPAWRKEHRQGRCGARHHRADAIDAAVWSEVRALLSNRDRLAQACAMTVADVAAGVDWRSQIDQCHNKLAELLAHEKEITSLMRRRLLSGEAATAELRTIANQRRTVERNLHVAQGQVAGAAEALSRLARVEQFAESWAHASEAAPFEQRRAILKALVQPPIGAVVLMKDGRAIIRGNVSGMPLEAVVPRKGAG